MSIIIIGLDGATFTVLDPLMKAGVMPNLHEISENGARGILRSTIPPQTATSWETFKTGTNPGKHGIYDFTKRVPGTYREIPVSSLKIFKPFWEVPGEKKYRSAILNIPLTYPAAKLNGVMITCFLTPGHRRNSTYPAELLAEIESKFGRYPFYLETTTSDEGEFFDAIDSMLEKKFKSLEYLTSKEQFDIIAFHVWGTDRLAHALWEILDKNSSVFDEKKWRKYHNRVESYYHLLDQWLGKVKANMTEKDSLLIISDHGFGSVKYNMNLNVWLLHEGYLVIKNSPVSRLKKFFWEKGVTPEGLFHTLKSMGPKIKFKIKPRPMIDVMKSMAGRRFLFLSLQDVDWEKTRAYSRLGLGNILINLKGREPQGIVKPGKEYQEIASEIREKLLKIKHPIENRNLRADIYLRDEIYHGNELSNAPDIMYLPLEEEVVPLNILNFSSNKTFTEPSGKGYHRMHGILMATGHGIQSGGKVEKASMTDIAPTVLYLLNQKIPTYMDGSVIQGLFTREYLITHPVLFEKMYISRDSGEYSEDSLSIEEQKDIEKKLKGLGYI